MYMHKSTKYRICGISINSFGLINKAALINEAVSTN